MEIAKASILEKVRAWIPLRPRSSSSSSSSSSVSRDFWMPDSSCRVCYECDSQFSLFNRRHHCRVCGRVFCAHCTQNTLLSPLDRRLRVCNFCFKSASINAARSSTSAHDSISSPTSTDAQPVVCDLLPEKEQPVTMYPARRDTRSSPSEDRESSSPNPYDFCNSRSDDEDSKKESSYQHSRLFETHMPCQDEKEASSCISVNITDDTGKCQISYLEHQDTSVEGNLSEECSFQNVGNEQGMVSAYEVFSESYDETIDDGKFYTPLYQEEHDYQVPPQEGKQPVDIENNPLIWVPPLPEEEEEGVAAVSMVDEDDDGVGGWGWPRTYLGAEGSKERATSDEQRKAMKGVVDGHFKALVAQLLNGEGIPAEEGNKESWLEIVTTLALEVGSIIKPDTAKGGGMDPGGYVKVKCIATGRRSESSVVKGVVCKKNVAHKRMTLQYKNPRLLLLGGALEYHRISNQLSSIDTLLQQETDHLSMTVARIEAHHPNILLVEKTISRDAQELLLARKISFVLNVNRTLLERIARCTGALVVPTAESLVAPKIGYCDFFHVERYIEEHASAGDKKSTKTLMFFEGCPKPLGCTVLLRGAVSDELKRVKRVIQLAVFAAYHLLLETSFLVDEGASLPELTLKSPICVTLPDTQSTVKPISTVCSSFGHAPGQIQIVYLRGQQIQAVSLPSSSSIQAHDAVEDIPLSGTSSYLPYRTNHLPPGTSPLSLGDHRGEEIQTVLQPYVIDTTINIDACSPCQTHDALKAATLSATSSYVYYKSNPPFVSTIPLSTGFQETAHTGAVTKIYSMEAGCSNQHQQTDTTFSGETRETESAPLCGHNALPSVSLRKGSLETDSAPLSCLQVKNEENNSVLINTLSLSYSSPNSCSLLPCEECQVERSVNTRLACLNLAPSSYQERHLTPEMDSQEYGESNQEDFPPSPSDHQSILVSRSSSCLKKRAVCEKGHLFRIKYYGSFDKPLGKFLRDDLFDQYKRCSFCDERIDAHVYCYTHRQASLTISVKHQNQILPGEKEGRIWMWHRCLKCSQVDSVPPATRRLVMSDAAWGLSFGKFLELNFSNHAAASRLAICGHSLHRDCIRFYGFGRMVACFRYAPITVHSVYLPPSKLEFYNAEQQGWLEDEVQEITKLGDLVFAEAFDSLRQIGERVARCSSGKASEARRHIAGLEALLQREKAGFEDALLKTAPVKPQPGQLVADILELNRLRRALALCSTQWVIRLKILAPTLKLVKPDSGSNSMLFGDPSILVCKKGTENITDSRDSVKEKFYASANRNFNISSTTEAQSIVTSSDGLPSASELRSDSSGKAHILMDKLMPVDVNNFNDHASRDGEQVSTERYIFDGYFSEREFSSSEENEMIIAKQVTGPSSCGMKPMDTTYTLSGVDVGVHRTLSEGNFPDFPNLPDTFEAAWIGRCQSVGAHIIDTAMNGKAVYPYQNPSDDVKSDTEHPPMGHVASNQEKGLGLQDLQLASTPVPPEKPVEFLDELRKPAMAPFSTSYLATGNSSSSSFTSLSWGEESQRLCDLFSIMSNGGKLTLQGPTNFLPLGIHDSIILIYDDEPTSIVAYALVSNEYQAHLLDSSLNKDTHKEKEKGQREKEKEPKDVLTNGSMITHPLQPADSAEQSGLSFKDRQNKSDGNLHASFELVANDALLQCKAMHVKVSFSRDGPQRSTKYTVTCYYAKQFDALRKKCCPSEMEFVRSLCRCKKWGAQGGKSNVFFAKTSDDRLVIKQVTKTELESFIKFAPQYFKYLSHALSSGSPTCLAKILGIFQVTVKHGRGGKEIRMDLMAMENLLYGRHVSRIYDLKGSARSRYNADTAGANKILLDQNLLELMQTHPIFIGNKAKRLLERAVWNDTAFLASVDVMDYSLLVGIDEERQELVLGIIDFVRQYTWDKHLETWVKASGILGGPKNAAPTVISPKEYKKRFRKAMSTYFLMVPDQWSPPTLASGTLSDAANETFPVVTKDEA